MSEGPTAPGRSPPPWWPKQASWQGRSTAPGKPPSPLGPPPPPAGPPIAYRILGVLLLAATLTLASCQAFIAAVSAGAP